jgi:hypothetical protein
MSTIRKPIPAVILSLLSGISIILIGPAWGLWTGSGWWDWMDEMMDGWDGHFNNWNIGDFAYPLVITGLVLGAAIIIVAVMLYKNPAQHELWGTLIIVFSVVSVISFMGGMGIGLLLGIIGGILAVLWKPQET